MQIISESWTILFWTPLINSKPKSRSWIPSKSFLRRGSLFLGATEFNSISSVQILVCLLCAYICTRIIDIFERNGHSHLFAGQGEQRYELEASTISKPELLTTVTSFLRTIATMCQLKVNIGNLNAMDGS